MFSNAPLTREKNSVWKRPQNFLARALKTVVWALRGNAGLRGCCCWLKYDRLAGYLKFEGGALINIKVRKND